MVRVVFEIESVIDIPYVSYDVTIWTAVELNTGLFCASAPSLKPVIQKFMPGILTSIRSSKMGSKFSYGKGTNNKSGRNASGAFELSSQTNLGSSIGKEGQIWDGDRDRGRHETSCDTLPNNAVLDKEYESDIGIRRTVKVTISDSPAFDFDIERNAKKGTFLRD